jgi:RND family efflux transporter MFP subunit
VAVPALIESVIGTEQVSNMSGESTLGTNSRNVNLDEIRQHPAGEEACPIMSVSKPIAAMAASCLLMSVAALAQTGGAGQRPADSAVESVVLEELARIDYIERSEVAALREGVIQTMELQIGMPVKKDGTIGVLHHEMAELTVTKNKLQADSIAPTEKAEAQKEVALSVCARNKRLNERKAGMVSAEDVAKADGELKVAEAQLKEAKENRGIAKADLELAVQTLKEHTIVSPFDGVILKRMKNPGESVRANEAVVQLGNLNKLCANAYVPLDFAFRVKEGQVVEIQPRITQGKGELLAVEKKRFRGKITFIDPQIQPVAETTATVRIRAEFDNPGGELRPGLPVQMTVFLTTDVAAAGPEGAATTQTARNQ